MNPPNWFNVIQNSQDVTYDSLNMTAISNGTYPAANSDGWDTFRSSNIVIQNCNVNNDDDCVAFKPNSTEILVQNMHCNGSHGISVGSLGQYLGETDIVENVYISNIHMSNASVSDGICIQLYFSQQISRTALVSKSGLVYLPELHTVAAEEMVTFATLPTMGSTTRITPGRSKSPNATESQTSRSATRIPAA